jgi:hypothetical protein
MNDYNLYSDAADAVNRLIHNKEQDIKSIEQEIFSLKRTRRMLDEEFSKSLNKKEKYIG